MANYLRTLWSIFFAFLKVGTFGYGGGPSMIPLIQQEVVEANRWMTENEFLDHLAMGNALPGPIAVKMAAYIGYRIAGAPGAVMALLGENLPGLALMFLLALVYLRIKDNPSVAGALQGARVAVIGLLLWTTYDLAVPVIRAPRTGLAGPLAPWDRMALALVTFAVVTFLNVHPVLVILAGTVLGVLIY